LPRQSLYTSASTSALVGAGTAAAANAPPSPTSTSAEAPLPKVKAIQPKVDVTCCGFPKKLIGGASFVLERDVFGDDACFIANFKATHVAGECSTKLNKNKQIFEKKFSHAVLGSAYSMLIFIFHVTRRSPCGVNYQ
jgi:hypothetical protein